MILWSGAKYEIRPHSYSWSGLELGCNGGIIKKISMLFACENTPCISLVFRLVPNLYREYDYNVNKGNGFKACPTSLPQQFWGLSISCLVLTRFNCNSCHSSYRTVYTQFLSTRDKPPAAITGRTFKILTNRDGANSMTSLSARSRGTKYPVNHWAAIVT